MKPEIVGLKEIKLIGMHINHSLSNNKTTELWKKFMPRKKEILSLKNSWFYAIQQYGTDVKMREFTPNTKFKIWAAVEVNSVENIPREMNSIVIPSGKYAIFMHKGDAKKFSETMNFILKIWLSESQYELDDRMHFQIMKDKYLGENNPNSVEEIWIPIK